MGGFASREISTPQELVRNVQEACGEVTSWVNDARERVSDQPFLNDLDDQVAVTEHKICLFQVPGGPTSQWNR
jgi:hypothetical protein